MRLMVLQFISIMLYGAAGFCVFLMVLNRFLILIADRKLKTPFILVSFAVVVGGAAALGFFFPRLPWALAPFALLCLVLIGEVRRAVVRRSSAGSGPVDTIPHNVSIMRPVTTTDFIVHRFLVPHAKWNRDQLRIVHLTDLHVSPNLPLDYYQEVVTAAEQAKPDIAVFTGDFITTINALPKLRQVLRPIARLATYAVLGNHDHWAGADAVRAVVRESGLCLLTNESATLRVGDENIMVTGYDYPWGTKAMSVPAGDGGLLHLVLSHTPDNIYRISRASGDIVFSGHYHAGQIRLPVIGAIVIPSVYGRRFDHGHFIVNGVHLFVGGGIGAAIPPVRIYCQPDIFIVDVVPREAGSVSINH